MTDKQLDEQLDRMIIENVGADYKVSDLKSLRLDIEQLIASREQAAVAKELKLMLNAEIIKPEYHNTVVGKWRELTNSEGNDGYGNYN